MVAESPLKVGMHGGDPNWGFLGYFGVPDLEVRSRCEPPGGVAEVPLTTRVWQVLYLRDPQGLRFGLHQR